jgi:ATPase subunit of ABC transporter with duplicated ATPase domains
VSLLAAHGVSFSYCAAPLLAGVDLTVAAGDAVAVVGPNGYDGTLLLVTHDRQMLARIPVTRHITVVNGKLSES